MITVAIFLQKRGFNTAHMFSIKKAGDKLAESCKIYNLLNILIAVYLSILFMLANGMASSHLSERACL